MSSRWYLIDTEVSTLATAVYVVRGQATLRLDSPSNRTALQVRSRPAIIC